MKHRIYWTSERKIDGKWVRQYVFNTRHDLRDYWRNERSNSFEERAVRWECWGKVVKP